MRALHADRLFTGSIPDNYETLLVPLIFEPYASDLAGRVAALRPSEVLELAAGTGAATRALARLLPRQARLVATDLNQPMLDRAAATGTEGRVEWRQADALRLPFEDRSFDAVACQFGVMFFPDVVAAFAEARRVLRPGGSFLFSVWDRIEENEFADSVTRALSRLFPEDPPRFLERTPHGYHDRHAIRRDLAAAGFGHEATIVTVASRSRAEAPSLAAQAYCQGTPVRNEIVARPGRTLEEATTACAGEIARRFGAGSVEGKIQAHLVSIVA